MPKKKPAEPEKHPREMTTEEALDHLFHPKIAKAARKAAGKPEKPGEKRKPG